MNEKANLISAKNILGIKRNRILSFKKHAESEKPTCLFLRLLYALDSRCCGGILNASFREEMYLPFS